MTIFKRLIKIFEQKSPYNDSVANFINKLIDLEEYPGSIHKCPQCGRKFHFHLTILKQRHPKMAAVQAWCDDCKARIAIDGIVPPPKWAEEATQVWAKEFQSEDTDRAI